MTGPEDKIREFVGAAQSAGLKIRARTPADPADWTQGVEIFDRLALRDAKSVFEDTRLLIEKQRAGLEKRIRRERKAWVRAIATERKKREERFDSITGFLEPNMKYGPGGLRDLEQGRQILDLFPELFAGEAHTRRLFDYYGDFWLTLRQRLHLDGFGEVLSGGAQLELAKDLGYKDNREFMRQVQRGLSRVRFYVDWLVAESLASEVARKKAAKKFATPSALWAAFKKAHDIRWQMKVRKEMDGLFTDSWIKKNAKQRGRWLREALLPKTSENFLIAVFESRLIEKLCPDIRPLVGYVQHDQYHRYSADVHLLQVAREVKRVIAKPRLLGPMASEVKSLPAVDQEILAWTAFCHDLMKGRPGDHSRLGEEWVEKNLAAFGVPEKVWREVQWLVAEHLALSHAAFRKNPWSTTTWAELDEKGAAGQRLKLLALFTAVDIRGTNPEAWTPWKARLIVDLLRALRSPKAKNYLEWDRLREKAKLNVSTRELDAFLLESLPLKSLLEDLKKIAQEKKDQAPWVWSHKKKGVWIRFHSAKDRQGLFADYVQWLFSLGLGIRHAAVHTLPGIGVYDWFELNTKKDPAMLRKWLTRNPPQGKALPPVKFESIEVISENEEEWILSFKGTDQPGFLAVAADALHKANINILSARVHTWGRQAEDLFHVAPAENMSEKIASLKELTQKP